MTRIKADGQEMDLMVDTGSEGLFFIDKDSLGKLVPHDEACESYPYGCYKGSSKGCKEVEIKNRFCDGSCAHLVCEEGTIEAGGEVITGVQFGLVINYTPVGHWPHAALGMALREGGDGRSISFIRQLRNKGLIDTMDFSMYFSRGNPNEGELIIGGHDPNRRGALLEKIPLGYKHDRWTIVMTRVRVGEEEEITMWQEMTIDSGSTDLCLSTDVYEKVVESLKRESTKNAKREVMVYDSTIHRWYLSSCSDRSHMPSIEILFSAPPSWPIEIPQKFYVESQNTSTGERCYLALHADDSTQHTGIIGVNLLRKYYISFLYNERQITFSSVKANRNKNMPDELRQIGATYLHEDWLTSGEASP
ncbi:hypothetical protein FOL47_010355 [Perkinsus chesapeaki]|uniref:Peptidase A1 domain-containing protein n=1 Tax=Perkinsus chesapeaki TaxID=330153 RepID=A0A7J6N1K1_PERCH|nr:hypothetical protein FOL47_010355 [Perkinsus chesapeaki]